MTLMIYTVLFLTLIKCSITTAQTACNSSPCLNNGVCWNSYVGDTFYCGCIGGYIGVQCEISLPGTCPPDYACYNGKCQADIMGNPHCYCDFGYEGVDCNSRPDTAFPLGCTQRPCGDHGVCFTSSVDSSQYICFCEQGYQGTHCEAELLEDPCRPNPCENSGNCTVSGYNPEGYGCSCPLYYSGQNCSTDDRLTCMHDGVEYSNSEVRESECNLCTCNNGDWTCTETLCGGMCQYEDMVFQDNDYRMDECNTCYCLHGAWMCTEKQCFTGNECEFNEAGSDVIEIYSENDYRWEECNVCYCLSGLWACTTKSCSNRTVINVSFEFDGNFATVVSIAESFKIVLRYDISETYNIPLNLIEHIEIVENSGRIEVSFALIGSQDEMVDVNKYLSSLEPSIDNGDYTFTFNGAQYSSRPGTFYSEQIWPKNPSITETGIDSTTVLIIVCAVTGVGYIIIIVGVILYIRTANTKRQDAKYGNAKLPNRRTGLDNGGHKLLKKNRSRTLPTNLHM